MNIFSFIKNNVPILEIVQQYTNLKQVGAYWKGSCPFHSERTPSFTVSPNKDIFYCFGCQAGGDVISFTAKIENCSQLEAAKMLSEKYNIQIPTELLKELDKGVSDLDAKNRYFKMCQLIAIWCNKNLLKNKKALQYLENRNIKSEITEKFLVGYFEPGQAGLNSLNTFLKKEGILFQDLAEFSVIIDGNSGFYSPFEDRIIFPIKNSLGEFCAFGGRIWQNSDERAKYYNSKENPYFNKGSLLFGFDLAKKYIQSQKSAFLVEGYVDHLTMYQNGYKNTVATLGTACTVEHLKLLARFIEKLYVVYDGDNAGKQAILRLTELAWNVSIELKIISLPDGEDPASFLNKNFDFEDLISKSKNIYQFFIGSTKSEFANNSLSEKLHDVQKITKIIDQLQDPIKKTLLFQEVSQEFGIPLELIAKKYVPFENSLISENPLSLENAILGAILNDHNKLKFLKNLEIIDFFSDRTKKILNLIGTNNKFDLKEFIHSLEDNDKNLVLESYIKHGSDSNVEQMDEFDNLIKQFQKKNWKKIILKFKKDLAQETDIKRKSEKLEKLKDLQLKILSGSYE